MIIVFRVKAMERSDTIIVLLITIGFYIFTFGIFSGALNRIVISKVVDSPRARAIRQSVSLSSIKLPEMAQ
jgi:hypothetical protein